MHLNQSCKDREMQWLTIESSDMRRIIIINVYRPPQGDYKNACRQINNAIQAADLKDNTNIFLMGDFNINSKAKGPPAAKELGATTALWGLKPYITGITRPAGGASGAGLGTCIDNIFTKSEYISEAGIMDWNFSDHLAVAVKRKRAKPKSEKTNFTGRSYKNYVMYDLLA